MTTVVPGASSDGMPEPPATAAPPVVAPPPGHPRFPLIDSLRAIAALMVLLSHAIFIGGIRGRPPAWGASVFANGVQGVTVFFVISGFLLYRPFVASQLGLAKQPALHDYFVRRFLRIVPAYWLALTVLAIYPGLPDVFTHNWYQYYFLLSGYSRHYYIGGLLVSWSLGVEITFYLVLPLYAAAVHRLTRRLDLHGRVRAELWILAGLSAASAVLRWIDYAGANTLAIQQALPAFLFWFSLGMGLALLSAAGQAGWQSHAVVSIGRHPGRCWAAALAGYLVLCAVVGNSLSYSTDAWVLGYYVLGGLIALALVLPAVFGAAGGGWPRRVLAWPLLAWLGLISYGIYLWHVPILVWLHDHSVRWFAGMTLAAIIITIACAAASYYAVERPILRLKYRRPHRPAPAGGDGSSDSQPERSRVSVG